MKTLRWAWQFLWSRPLAAALNLLLLSLGLASITLVLLVNHQIQQAFARDLAGIDVVVGAKGSPLQLILSGVFQIDTPTGNVPLADVQTLQANPQVAKLIPISMGDSFKGYRIIGTTPDYLSHYAGVMASGALWQAPMQAVLGAKVARDTGLRVGDSFVGSHGLGGGGHAHGQTPYAVTGVLAPSGSVMDRLILTATESVWRVHEKDTALDAADQKILEEEREVTLALIQYLDLKTYLVGDINTKVDRASMAHSLEVREPLMDHELVDWLATLPSAMKVRGQEGKYLLKKAMEPKLSADILYRPKMGFAVPLARWFRGPLKQRVRQAVLGPRLASTGWFNRTYLQHLVAAHQSGARDYSAPLWTLLMFEAFLRCVVDVGAVTDQPAVTEPLAA